MIDNNFTFDGLHCLADFGAIYVPSQTRPLIAPRSVVSYAIGGMSGTQAYGDASVAEAYSETGVFYPAGDLPSETEARAFWRRIAAWLTVGRRELIRDSEPERYVIAEVAQLQLGEYGWLDGGLQVTWLIQPYHWDRREQLHALTLTSAAPEASAALRVDTGRPAPVTATAAVLGDAPLTALEILVGGKRVRLSGMEIQPGEQLRITTAAPIGAVIIAADGSIRDAMPCMEELEALEIPSGGADGSASAAFGSAGGRAEISIAARGCWE